MKNTSLKYKKSEKQTFDISMWVKKTKIIFFLQKCVLAVEEVISLWLLTKKNTEKESFKLNKGKFEKKKSLEYKKK